ncbi:SIMPL domain-containing protein [Actinospica durhamensis]|uniref:SIMPL domain-containing protein n=1 Tax=Actinospica durhamensis TaxID=1508375 RepID=A0A941IV62_9ACTN|nr:SIMPL domain-containing protein [Actinospica durhamensis]MBR7836501.1 SIMPL domain-containing protein [Actinospica durhamensis]
MTASAVVEQVGSPAVISVRGEALLTVEPELVDLTVVVAAQAKERREAFERLVKRNDELLELLRSYGDSVEKVESSGVAVHPEVRKGGRDEKVRSYRGVVRVEVSIADFAALGEIVSRVADLEAAHLEGPRWRLRRTSPVYRKARTRAVGEALTRAQDYAEALGARITGLIEVADSGLMQTEVHRATHAVLQARAASAPAAFGPNSPEPPVLELEPALQEVRASVEARFSATQPIFEIRPQD